MPLGEFPIQPKAGFDWRKVIWGRPDAVVSPLCSYCSASFKESDVPLVMFKPDGHCAKFCDRCMKKWWGLQ